jgi:hypothetical protein
MGQPAAGEAGQAFELERHLFSQCGDDVTKQLVEVKGHRTGLVHRLRLFEAKLVGLPDLVDQLGHPPIDPITFRIRSPGIESFVDEVGQGAKLGEDRASGGLGGMGGEHRSQLQPPNDVLDQRRSQAGVEDPVDGGPQRALLLRSGQIADAVDLFGDVGEIEVRGEGPHELDRLGEFEGIEQMLQLGSGLPIVVVAYSFGEGPNFFDEVEKPFSVLAGQGLSELIAQTTDVCSQCLVGCSIAHPEDVNPDGQRHRCPSLGSRRPNPPRLDSRAIGRSIRCIEGAGSPVSCWWCWS